MHYPAAAQNRHGLVCVWQSDSIVVILSGETMLYPAPMQNSETSDIEAGLSDYLQSGEFIDSDNESVRLFARESTSNTDNLIRTAVELYYAVRDGIIYDPYYVGENRRYFRASACLEAGRGFCQPKSALLAASARVMGIPARVGYADVRNHLSTARLEALVGSDVYVWHSYTELYLEGRWVKATPAFNLSMCERFDVHPLEFDGRSDSLFQEFDRQGKRHMEYVQQRGHFVDLPYEQIIDAFLQYHPRWLAARDQKQEEDSG